MKYPIRPVTLRRRCTAPDDWICLTPLLWPSICRGGRPKGVLVRPDSERILRVEPRAKTLDLHAGQVVDRVGRMLQFRSFRPGRNWIDWLARATRRIFCVRPSKVPTAACPVWSTAVKRCSGGERAGRRHGRLLHSVHPGCPRRHDRDGRWTPARGANFPMVCRRAAPAGSWPIPSSAARSPASTARSLPNPALSSDNAAGVAVLAALMQERGCGPCRG